MGSWKIGKIKVEEMTDVDPEVYARRAKEALNKGGYDTAIREAEIALKYSKNSMKYHTLMAEILFKAQEYKQCLEYIRKYKLVDYFLSDEFAELAESGSWWEATFVLEEDFFNSYMVCWEQCVFDLKKADVVIVRTNGSGMVKTLQEAIDMDSSCRKIVVISDSENDKVNGVIKGKKLSIGIVAPLYEQPNVHIIIKSGDVRIVNSKIKVEEKSVGIEVDGGNVSLINTEVYGDNGRNDFSIGIYVKNQATVDIKYCQLHAGFFAECGKIKVKNTLFKAEYNKQEETHIYVVAIGKNGKVELKLLECRIERGSLLAGFNTNIQIHGGYYGDDSFDDWIVSEGKLFNDSQNDTVINIYDSHVKSIAAYNSGNIYLHDVEGIEFLAADNGKILGENCESSSDASLKLGVGKSTEILCDCKYAVNEYRNRLIKECRMGKFLKGVKWLSKD